MVGDGTADNIPAGAITSANTNGSDLGWIVTDSAGYILGLPPMPSAVNFDGPGAGTCFIYRIASEGTITGLELGSNTSDLVGCFSLSNSIEVTRTNASGCDANGGALFGGPFSFCVNDNVADNIPAGAITSANTNGDTLAWIVTDASGKILGLPPMPSAVDFEGVDAGVCFIYRIAYDGIITGFEVQMNIADIAGCYSLSNSIEVTRLTGTDCNTLSIDGFSADFSFNVYPNPTSDSINIEYEGNRSLTLSVQVIDMLGKQVTNTSSSKERNVVVDLSRLTSGTYFVNIVDTDSGSAIVKRVVKK